MSHTFFVAFEVSAPMLWRVECFFVDMWSQPAYFLIMMMWLLYLQVQGSLCFSIPKSHYDIFQSLAFGTFYSFVWDTVFPFYQKETFLSEKLSWSKLLFVVHYFNLFIMSINYVHMVHLLSILHIHYCSWKIFLDILFIFHVIHFPWFCSLQAHRIFTCSPVCFLAFISVIFLSFLSWVPSAHVSSPFVVLPS